MQPPEFEVEPYTLVESLPRSAPMKSLLAYREELRAAIKRHPTDQGYGDALRDVEKQIRHLEEHPETKAMFDRMHEQRTKTRTNSDATPSSAKDSPAENAD